MGKFNEGLSYGLGILSLANPEHSRLNLRASSILHYYNCSPKHKTDSQPAFLNSFNSCLGKSRNLIIVRRNFKNTRFLKKNPQKTTQNPTQTQTKQTTLKTPKPQN